MASGPVCVVMSTLLRETPRVRCAALLGQRKIRGALRLLLGGKHARDHRLLTLALLGALFPLSAATSPNAQAQDNEHKDETACQDVRPAAQDHLLIFLLLLVVGNGRMLHLVRWKQSPAFIPGGVHPAKTGFDEVLTGFVDICDRGDLNVRMSTVRRIFNPVAEVHQSVRVPYCQNLGEQRWIRIGVVMTHRSSCPL